jgi:glycosyltransferase involved in cell wall biosynthesis
VSIGLPVYNGDEFVEESIESLLSQSFRDFELLISDNASTDRTEEICRRFAERDKRVQYWRNSKNIGGMRNADLTFERARGEYFRWAAHDDVCEPTMLERLVAELDAHPEVALCCAAAVSIDVKGDPMPGYLVGKVHFGRGEPDRFLVTDADGVRHPTEGTAPRASDRMREILATRGPCEATYGLIRTGALRQTVLLGDYTSSDTVLLCDLALRTRFLWLDEPLFSKRWHPGNLYQERGPGRMVWSRPELATSGRPTFPHWLLLSGYLSVVRRAPLSDQERLRCLAAVGRWAAVRWKALAYDLAFAARMMLHSKEWRRARYSPETWTAVTE